MEEEPPIIKEPIWITMVKMTLREAIQSRIKKNKLDVSAFSKAIDLLVKQRDKLFTEIKQDMKLLDDYPEDYVAGLANTDNSNNLNELVGILNHPSVSVTPVFKQNGTDERILVSCELTINSPSEVLSESAKKMLLSEYLNNTEQKEILSGDGVQEDGLKGVIIDTPDLDQSIGIPYDAKTMNYNFSELDNGKSDALESKDKPTDTFNTPRTSRNGKQAIPADFQVKEAVVKINKAVKGASTLSMIQKQLQNDFELPVSESGVQNALTRLIKSEELFVLKINKPFIYSHEPFQDKEQTTPVPENNRKLKSSQIPQNEFERKLKFSEENGYKNVADAIAKLGRDGFREKYNKWIMTTT